MRRDPISFQIRTSSGLWAAFGALLLALTLIACDSPEKRGYRAFTASARASVNPKLLQQQVSTLLAHYTPGDQVPFSQVPPEIMKLVPVPPAFAFIGRWGDSKEGALVVAWGNGFAHWGIIVGSPTFRLADVDHLTVTEWIPGLGFFLG
jgi:hypothetical protein